MSHYTNGRRFEYKVRDALTADGYEVIRSAGSKGKVDLVAFKEWARTDPQWLCWHMLFIQCKRTDGTITKDERAGLLRLARIARAVAVVAYQPIPRKPIRYRRLTGPGPKQWVEWTPDQVGAA